MKFFHFLTLASSHPEVTIKKPHQTEKTTDIKYTNKSKFQTMLSTFATKSTQPFLNLSSILSVQSKSLVANVFEIDNKNNIHI